MKKANWSFLGLIIALVGLFAFASVKEGGIQGKITPSEGVKAVIATSGTDTLTSQLSDGVFVFSNVRKGTYTLWVQANAPYKDTTVENVAVTDSTTTDVGEIRLEQ